MKRISSSRVVTELTISLLCTILFKHCECESWALLVAGSKGFLNYRHQSDVCRMYHVIRNYGIPPQNIIVMMNDDIAHNPRNPFPGKIFNEPNGKDVYSGVPKDYTGKHISVINFERILTGKNELMKNIGTGKVINSTKNDVILIYYSDHGGPGVISLVNEPLFAKDLNKIFTVMAKKEKFGYMILFIEACHGGSMFSSLLNSRYPIFALTASSPFENSYPAYYDSKIRTYLGDEFSTYVFYLINYKNHLSLHHLYKTLQAWVQGSTVHSYGNSRLTSHTLRHYLGHETVFDSAEDSTNDVLFKLQQEQQISKFSSVDTVIDVLKKEKDEATTLRMKKLKTDKIYRILKARIHADNVMATILVNVANNDKQKLLQLNDTRYFINRTTSSCAKQITIVFSNWCFNVIKSPYVMSILGKLIVTCNVPWTNDRKTAMIIRQVCSRMKNGYARIL